LSRTFIATLIRPVLAIVGKDLVVWLRRPSSIAATVLPGIVFMLVILVSAGAVGRNPVALVQLDSGPQAQRLAGVLERSDAFRVEKGSPTEAQRMLDQLDVAAVITIPADFDAAYASGRPDPVTIEINNLNLDFTNDLRRSLPAAITDFYGGQPSNPIRVVVIERDLRAHDIGLVQFMMVPNLVLLLTVAGVINCGLATAREFEDLTIKELTLAPVGRAPLIAGKIIAGWVTTLILAAIVLMLGAVFGFLRPAGAYWLIAIGVIGLFALAAAGLGAAVGAAARRFTGVMVIGISLALYLFFLSGGISVAAFLPDWIQAVARLTPTYYAVHALQTAVFYQSTEDLPRDLIVLTVTAIAGLVAGIAALGRRVVA
jgi:ABC-2 type transport system permease protein